MPVTAGPAAAQGPGRSFRSSALSTVTSWFAIEWDVFSLPPGGSAAAPTYLATLYEAREKSIRVELDGTGTGQFAINRSSPQCTEAILARGNVVKVRIPEIHTGYLFAFFIETGDFTLISSDEAGGEMLTFGGRGILAYFEYAQAWAHSYIDGGQDPIDGVWRAYLAGTGNAPGQVLRRMIEEMQHADRGKEQWPDGVHAIPLLTVDFDYDIDSNGQTWQGSTATTEFSYRVGERGLEIIERLIPTGITVQMGPDFVLHAYNKLGRDLTGGAFGAGAVRFERGTNIATELRRSQAVDRVVTHDLVEGEANKYGAARLSDHAERVTKEGFVTAFGEGPAALNGIGRVDLFERLDESETITFPIANRRTADVVLSSPVSIGSPRANPGLAAAGYYLPGPPGTLGDFWLGDLVRLHTGSGPFDFTEVDARVIAITIIREDDNAELIITPELKEEPPTSPVYGVLWRVDTNQNIVNNGIARQLNWGKSGDAPPPGYPTRPTVGLIAPLADPAPYDSVYPWIGWSILGTGTVDVIVVASYIGVLEPGDNSRVRTMTLTLRRNGTAVPGATASRSHTGGLRLYSGVLAVDIDGVAVASGDQLTATLTLTGAGATPAKVALATGQNGERFEITGGGLS